MAAHGAMNVENIKWPRPEGKNCLHYFMPAFFFRHQLRKGANKEAMITITCLSDSSSSCEPSSTIKINQKLVMRTREIKKSLGKKNWISWLGFSAWLDRMTDKVRYPAKKSPAKRIVQFNKVRNIMSRTANQTIYNAERIQKIPILNYFEDGLRAKTRMEDKDSSTRPIIKETKIVTFSYVLQGRMFVRQELNLNRA